MSSKPAVLLLQAASLAICSYIAYVVYRFRARDAAYRRQRRLRNCRFPAKLPTLDPLFGLDFFYSSYVSLKEHRALSLIPDMYKIISSNTGQLRLFNRTIISTCEPENLKSVLSLDFKSWALPAERSKMLGPILGEGIFTSNGEVWKHSREMLRPNFVRTQVGDTELFERHVQDLFQKIPRDRSMIDLQKPFLGLTLDISTEFLFGMSTNCLKPSFRDEKVAGFVESFDYVLANSAGQESKWGILGLFLPNFTAKKNIRVIHGTFSPSLLSQQKLTTTHHSFCRRPDPNRNLQLQPLPARKYIFLHALLAQTPPPTPLRLRSELLNILLAGRDTTASVLSNLWFEISKRPDIFAALQREILPLRNAHPTFEQLKSLKYLQAVISESQRLYPIVPENSRVAIADTQLPVGGGRDGKSPVFAPKGRLVHWSIYAMHRRKDLFGEDAEEFKPERWLDGADGSKGLRTGWEYLPFSGMYSSEVLLPRMCRMFIARHGKGRSSEIFCGPEYTFKHRPLTIFA